MRGSETVVHADYRRLWRGFPIPMRGSEKAKVAVRGPNGSVFRSP